MEEDNSLFHANGALNGIWYFANLIALIIITAGVNIGIKTYAEPNVYESFQIPLKVISYFIYFIFVITFFMLIDRRLYSIFGSREKHGYLIITKIIGSVILLYLIAGIAVLANVQIYNFIKQILLLIACIFLFFVFVLGFFPESKKRE